MAGLNTPKPDWWDTADATAEASNQALQSTPHKERWKYTKLNKVLPLLSDQPVAAAQLQLPPGIDVSLQPLADVLDLQAILTQTPERLATLQAQGNLQVFDVTAAIDSVWVLPASNMPRLIRVAAGKTLSLHTLADDSTPDLSTVLWIQLGKGARVDHTCSYLAQIRQWHTTLVSLEQDASYHLHNHACGSALHRQDLHIDINAPGIEVSVTSSSVTPPSGHFDQQVTLQHRAPHAQSRQTYHNLVGNKGTVTFNGKIHIHPGSDGSNAALSNKNVALDPSATINTKPELEIYADDVQCAHGATVGQLDEDHAFYCSSRGIDPVSARRLLSHAFLASATTGLATDVALQHYTEVLA